jgi:hypothetical protein
LNAASKATTGAAFAKATPKKLPGHDAKAIKKAASDKRKAARAAATAAGNRPSDAIKPPMKK